MLELERGGMSGDVSVRVFCRFRPFNAREKALGGDSSQFLTLTDTSIKVRLESLPVCMLFISTVERLTERVTHRF